MNALPKSVFSLMHKFEPDSGSIVNKISSQILGNRVHFMEVILGLAQDANLFLITAVDT